MIILKKWIIRIKITFIFYFPQKSRDNCRTRDDFSNNIETVLFL